MMENLGYITVQMSQESMAAFYAEPWVNLCGCLINQYVLVADEQGNRRVTNHADGLYP